MWAEVRETPLDVKGRRRRGEGGASTEQMCILVTGQKHRVMEKYCRYFSSGISRSSTRRSKQGRQKQTSGSLGIMVLVQNPAVKVIMLALTMTLTRSLGGGRDLEGWYFRAASGIQLMINLGDESINATES